MLAEGPTREGEDRVEAIARRHAVSEDAVLTLVRAVERGRGEQAQFSHPELGGMGQWSSRGMIMIGDMFNTDLKTRVDALCWDVASLVREGEVAAMDAEGGGSWWPAGCGTASSSGSQDGMRYAVFPGTRRLAIERGGKVELYDSGSHRIGGVSQQSGSRDPTFTSQHGPVRLHDLERLEDCGSAKQDRCSIQARENARNPQPSTMAASGDIPRMIERLHELHREGILDEKEFAEKKRELLARI